MATNNNLLDDWWAHYGAGDRFIQVNGTTVDNALNQIGAITKATGPNFDEVRQATGIDDPALQSAWQSAYDAANALGGPSMPDHNTLGGSWYLDNPFGTEGQTATHSTYDDAPSGGGRVGVDSSSGSRSGPGPVTVTGKVAAVYDEIANYSNPTGGGSSRLSDVADSLGVGGGSGGGPVVGGGGGGGSSNGSGGSSGSGGDDSAVSRLIDLVAQQYAGAGGGAGAGSIVALPTGIADATQSSGSGKAAVVFLVIGIVAIGIYWYKHRKEATGAKHAS